jgi:hypothetical protein
MASREVASLARTRELLKELKDLIVISNRLKQDNAELTVRLEKLIRDLDSGPMVGGSSQSSSQNY